jgi:murein DD-endopeptidase MepM/ murein hydrolase activator NlpD
MERRETGRLNVRRTVRSISPVPKPISNLAALLGILIVTGLSGFLIWHFAGGAVKEIDADWPLPMPAGGEVDHRFHFLSAFESAQIPVATRFDPPLGSDHGGLVYNAQKFWEMNDERGGHHAGDDLNGIGGMNTDLGDPVYSTADGLVVYAGEPSEAWGKIVIVAHKLPDGRLLQSMYAHLHRIDVKRGDLVARGGRIGIVGTANGYYPAHLHFEMRASDGVDIGAGYADQRLNRLDPAATISALRNAKDDELSPSPLGRLVEK